jgi:transcriptional regulator GlxA family with amidase domain
MLRATASRKFFLSAALSAPPTEHHWIFSATWPRRSSNSSLKATASSPQDGFSELIAQEVGAGAMTASLIKQVLITVLRRSISSGEGWFERFPILSDPQIARAFAGMVAEPGASHTVESLARAAGLSRSSFMQRFTKVGGSSPLVVLRQLRMKKAAGLLKANVRSIEQIASAVGYKNQSGFSRAFRAIHGLDPMEYRATHSLGKLENLKNSLAASSRRF